MRYFKIWLAFGWLLVWLVCYFSLISNPPKIDLKFENLDKIVHALSYFVLMSWFAQLYQSKQSRMFYALFFILLGVTLEYIQGLGHTRLFEYADMLANTTGVLMGLLLTKGKLKGALLLVEDKMFR